MKRSRKIAKTLSSVTPKDIPKVKKEIKRQLRVLQYREIRRHRVPYYEVVVTELHEEGYHETAEYFTFLFNLDEETRQIAGPNTLIWNKPRLRDNHELIDYLRDVLKIFCKWQRPAMERIAVLTETAMYIQTLTWEWWWIAETLYRSAFYIARNVEDDSKKSITILRYIYARFLFFQMKNSPSALHYAQMAHRDSRDKPWNASKFFGTRQESLFRECCSLLHKILMSIALTARKCDPKTAIECCEIALTKACDSGHEDILAEAHFELGRSLIAAGDVQRALKHFYKSLALLEAIPDPEGICNAHAELAQAYEKINNPKRALEHWQSFKDEATKYELSHRVAEALYNIGEFYLARNNSTEATPNLQRALSIYNLLGAKDDANRTRCLLGVSKGQSMMESYQALIMQSIEGVPDAILKLCLWKDRGESFD